MSHLKKIAHRLKFLAKRTSAKREPERRRMLFETLEKRLLLSADPITASQDLQNQENLLPDSVSVFKIDTLEIETTDGPSQQADLEQTSAETITVDTSSESTGDNGEESSQEKDDAAIREVDLKADAPETENSESSAIDTDNNENTLVKENISFQLSYLLSEESGHHIVIIDQSVPEYELLIENIFEDVSDRADEQTTNTGEIQFNGSEESDMAQGLPASDEITSELSTSESKRGSSDVSEDSSYEIIILDSDRDGIEQITEVLAQYDDVSSIHVVSHGAAGVLRLGNSIVDRNKLEEYSQSLRAWQNSMVEGGDILLYGCNVARGELGIGFITELSRFTGADVAASTDASGAKSHGGDWILEYTSGVIESTPLFQASELSDYNYLLEDIIGTDGDDTLQQNNGVNDTITGGVGDDIYRLEDGWGTDVVIEASEEGTDTLDFSEVTADLTFTLNNDGSVSVTDGTNTLTSAGNIEKIIGGSGHDTLKGPGGGAEWKINGDNEGNVKGLFSAALKTLRVQALHLIPLK